MSPPAKPGIGAILRRRIATLRHYHEIAQVGEIVRRYFAMNAFDGVLTAIGVLVGGYLGDVDSPRAIFIVVLTTAVGMGVSGFYGSYLVEKAERGRAMRELEESTLSSLRDTTIGAASRYATIVIAFVDGASPFAAALIVMIPFAFTSVVTMHTAYYLAVCVGLIELFFLGAFLGAISRERLWLSGMRLMVAGVIALVISLLLGGGIG
jgi:predicted membrane protein (TIGR00267 family)